MSQKPIPRDGEAHHRGPITTSIYTILRCKGYTHSTCLRVVRQVFGKSFPYRVQQGNRLFPEAVALLHSVKVQAFLKKLNDKNLKRKQNAIRAAIRKSRQIEDKMTVLGAVNAMETSPETILHAREASNFVNAANTVASRFERELAQEQEKEQHGA